MKKDFKIEFTVYVKPEGAHCTQCDAVKLMFDNNNVEYVTQEIDDNVLTMAHLLGIKTAPITVITSRAFNSEEKVIVGGYDKDLLQFWIDEYQFNKESNVK